MPQILNREKIMTVIFQSTRLSSHPPPFPPTVYLILGLIVMLVVLETFCELQQLKQLRKMFYVKKEKPQDRLAILEHDHLSFATVSKRALSEDKSHPFVSSTTLVGPNDDHMID